MNYEQSNVGPGMVPHCAKCSCDECRIERLASQMESANRAVQLERGKVEKADRENDRLTRGLAEAREAARVWENEAERRSRRYEKCAVELATVTAQRDAAEANLARLQQRWDERPVRSTAPPPSPQTIEDPMTNIWFCKIGENTGTLPSGADAPMRAAIREAYLRLTGREPNFIFSGWGGELTEGERAVHENRGLRNPPPQPDVCPHGIRAPWECKECADAAWKEAVDDSIDGRCPVTGEPDGEPHPDAPARAYWPADNSPAIRPHDTGPDYQHGPGCLCRYCDDK